MADNFTVTKTEKETKTGRTITIDIKRNDNGSRTISGDIENVVAELKKMTISQGVEVTKGVCYNRYRMDDQRCRSFFTNAACGDPSR